MKNRSIFLTIAICTFNRARLLAMTLTQMTHLKIPEDCEWEILIINNNSNDNTEDVVRMYHDELPIRCIFEKNQGLSYARNRAIAEAKGEFIIWTDDDVLVDQNWLIEYRDGFKRHSQAVFFGGPIQPLFKSPPPRWLKKNFRVFRSAFACRDLGNEEIILNSRSGYPFGANMAVRKDAYESLSYNVELGRIGTNMLSHEETDIFEKLDRLGKKGFWLPRAYVKHYIPSIRMTSLYLRRYFRGYGQTLVRLTNNGDDVGPLILGFPRWTIRFWLTACVKWIFTALFMRHKCAENWINLQLHIGKMIEYRNKNRL